MVQSTAEAKIIVGATAAVVLDLVLMSLPFSATQVVGTVMLATVLVGLAALGIVKVGRSLAGVDPAAPAIAERLAGDELSQRLLTRWLRRVRWRRYVGGAAGVVVGLFPMDANQLPRMFSFGLAGMVIGSLSAELHHCRRRRGPASADLTPRRFRDFVQARDVGVLGAIGVLAAGVIVAAAAAGVDSSSATAGWAAASAGVVVLVAGLQWRVVTRRRPALRPELRQADDLMRRLAVSHGLAHPGITLGLGLLGQALLAAGMPLAGVICWLLAVGSWWTNRAVGLDHLLREPPPPFRT